MFKFICKHPAQSLFVRRDSTAKDRDEEFLEVTHHLYCMRCGKNVDIGFSMCKTTIPEYVEIAMAKLDRERSSKNGHNA